jgi:hypothetical protein
VYADRLLTESSYRSTHRAEWQVPTTAPFARKEFIQLALEG